MSWIFELPFVGEMLSIAQNIFKKEGLTYLTIFLRKRNLNIENSTFKGIKNRKKKLLLHFFSILFMKISIILETISIHMLKVDSFNLSLADNTKMK